MNDHFRLSSLLLTASLFLVGSTMAEDWPGYEAGGTQQNASIQNIDPASLKVVWQRSFSPVQYSEKVTIGSRNLVCVGGKLAILQPSEEGFPQERRKSLSKDRGNFARAYVSILDAASGKTLNCLGVWVRAGQRHNVWYPTGLLVDAADTLSGQHIMHWDVQSGTLFLRSGGDGSFATAYHPLENLQSYKGDWQPGVAAFTEGRSLPQWKQDHQLLDIDEWAPIRSNDTSFFQISSEAPYIVITGGHAHNQCGGIFFTHKDTGMPIPHTFEPALLPINNPVLPKGEATKSPLPFTRWGSVAVERGRIYYLSAGDDNDADGFLGSSSLCADSMTPDKELEKDRLGQGSKRWKVENPDQGLHVCAYDVEYISGESPSLKLKPAFIHRFVSPHKPAKGPADCQSYLETDHFYRNKTMLVDDGGVWVVWQKSSAYGAELIRVSKEGAQTWPIEVCKGMRGQDVWPHLALAKNAGEKYLAYYAGNAYRQDYLDDTPPYRPVDCFGPQREALGPAQLAVFDIQKQKLAYTFDLSAAYPSLPPNLAQHYLDQSQMVVAGKTANVGWIDLTQEKAQLCLAGFDVTSSTPKPILKTFPLDFDSKVYPKTMLTDLIAVDGMIYALVTKASKLAPDYAEFESQIVISLK